MMKEGVKDVRNIQKSMTETKLFNDLLELF